VWSPAWEEPWNPWCFTSLSDSGSGSSTLCDARAGSAKMSDNDDIPETRTYGTANAPVLSSDPSARGVAPEQLGRYRVGGRLGAGGMGIVYEAIDPALDRKVAVKLLRSGRGGASAHARMSREAQAMARLSHRNVLHVYDVGLHADQVFVAMEYVDGETLTEWLKSPRPWREVLGAFIDAGRGCRLPTRPASCTVISNPTMC
jgi:serine/threonine protein kinase